MAQDAQVQALVKVFESPAITLLLSKGFLLISFPSAERGGGQGDPGSNVHLAIGAA